MNESELRAVLGGEPAELVKKKIADRLNSLTRQFIERSPFVVVATGTPGGGLDVSPRGDPAGFVRILDDRTLLIPDRPGNKLADTLTNLLEDDRIALLFLVPGVNDTFRVNGRAQVVDDAELLAASEVEGKVPRLGVLVRVEEAYTQCPKALLRSELWNPERHVERSELPSSGAILRAVADPELDVEDTRTRAPSATGGARASTSRRRWRNAAEPPGVLGRSNSVAIPASCAPVSERPSHADDERRFAKPSSRRAAAPTRRAAVRRSGAARR